MRLLAAFVLYEWRLQLRSLRFRFGLAICLLLGAAGPVLLFSVRDQTATALGFNSYLARTLHLSPLLTAVLAVLVAGNTARLEGQLGLIAPACMSNAGFLLRKWLAQSTLVLAGSLLALLLGCTPALLAGTPLPSPLGVLLPWLLQSMPVGLTIAALWLGLVTLLRSELLSILVGLFGVQMALSLVNRLLYPLRLRLVADLDTWSGWPYVQLLYSQLWMILTGDTRFFQFFAWTATESAYDGRAVLEWMAPRAALWVGLAAFALAVAVAYVGRTRPDAVPIRVGERHPLRTFLGTFGRFRQRYRPDLALERPDRLLLAGGLAILLASAAYVLHRAHVFSRQAREHYEVLVSDPLPPTAPGLAPSRWSIRGRLGAGGEVDVEVSGRFVNLGEGPRSYLAFEINRHLEVLEVAVGGRQARSEVRVDRLAVHIEPGVAPREEAELSLRLRGTPAENWYDLRSAYGSSLAGAYPGLPGARYAAEVPPMAYSARLPRITRRAARLAAVDLTPVPRYTEWTLLPPPEAPGEPGLEVPEEQVQPEVELEIDLTGPDGWLLADSCGHHSGSTVRLVGSCRTRLGELVVVGGPFTPHARPGGRTAFGSLAAHAARGAEQVDALERIVEASDRAWPGRARIDRLTGVEWPPPPSSDLTWRMGSWYDQEIEVEGRLLLVPELLVASPRPLPILDVVSGLLAEELLRGRPVVADEELPVRQFLRALMLIRMGLATQADAVLSGLGRAQRAYRFPILEAHRGQHEVWERRLPAVIHQLEHRIGRSTLQRGVESFLDAPPSGGEEAGAGTMRELLYHVERAAGVSLERLYRDYFTGDALPDLRLEGVEARRSDGGWEVEGRVRNVGKGEAVCPLVARTELHRVEERVTVPSGGETRFRLRTEEKPHTLVLDPEGVCVRFRPLGVSDRVHLGESLS